MRVVRPSFVLAAAIALAAGFAARAGEPVTVLLVRHAEKVDASRNPNLSEAGRARAQALVGMLEGHDVAALYASQFDRTQQTLAPLAAALGVQVTVEPISDAERSSVELAAAILERHAGQTVVVAGHSNTVPLVIEALGVTPAPRIRDDQYDDFFVVFAGGGLPARMLRLRYGD